MLQCVRPVAGSSMRSGVAAVVSAFSPTASSSAAVAAAGSARVSTSRRMMSSTKEEPVLIRAEEKSRNESMSQRTTTAVLEEDELAVRQRTRELVQLRNETRKSKLTDKTKKWERAKAEAPSVIADEEETQKERNWDRMAPREWQYEDEVNHLKNVALAYKWWTAWKYRVFQMKVNSHVRHALKNHENFKTEADFLEFTYRATTVAKSRFVSNMDRLEDTSTRDQLHDASVILGNYDLLVPLIGKEAAFSAMINALDADEENKLMKTRLSRASLWLSSLLGPGKDAKIKYAFEVHANRLGDAFSPSLYETKEGRFELHIHRCMFKDMFKDEATPELTPLFCQVEKNRLELLSGQAVTIEQTIQKGANSCIFSVNPDEAGG